MIILCCHNMNEPLFPHSSLSVLLLPVLLSHAHLFPIHLLPPYFHLHSVPVRLLHLPSVIPYLIPLSSFLLPQVSSESHFQASAVHFFHRHPEVPYCLFADARVFCQIIPVLYLQFCSYLFYPLMLSLMLCKIPAYY